VVTDMILYNEVNKASETRKVGSYSCESKTSPVIAENPRKGA
jgi:hypothetical protein